MTAPKRHLQPVAPIFAADPPRRRFAERASLAVDVAFFALVAVWAAWVQWQENRRARRWQP